VVGHGSIGSRHAENLRKLNQTVVVYDPLGPRHVKYERMIYDECDAVVLATPSHCHESGIRAAIERGKHVFVEKPISTSLGQLPALLDRAYEKDLVVMMGNNLRFHPCVKKTKEWIDHPNHFVGGPLWAMFTCATKTVKPPYLSDGVILNTGAHEVDLAMHFFGPATVLAASMRKLPDDREVTADDIADFVLLHRNGCRSTFHLDFVTEREIREYRIVGDEGDIYCDLPDRFVVRREPGHTLPNVSHVDTLHGPGTYDADYLEEMSAFLDRVEGKTSPYGADGYFGLDVLRVLLDVRKMAGLM
jgi:predicted dehydrogenase